MTANTGHPGYRHEGRFGANPALAMDEPASEVG
jgi:hypothetical protein